MDKEDLIIRGRISISGSQIDQIQTYFSTEREIHCSLSVLRDALTQWVAIEFDLFSEQLVELITSGPRRRDFEQTLQSHIEARNNSKVPQSPAAQNPTIFDMEPSFYSGMLKPSAEKIEDLIVFLAYRKKGVFPTVLNKLLFYSDFSSFSGRKIGITGYEYQKMDHGPAIPTYEDLLHRMEKKGRIKIKEITSRGKPARKIVAPKHLDETKLSLTRVERQIAEWVLLTYGHLSTDEIIKRSHAEDAWWNPEYGATLDYRAAESLSIQPPKEIF